MSMCGMNQGLTSVRILLSLSPLSPDTGTGSGFLHRTLVGPLAQPLSKQTPQRLTRLHILSPASESHLPLIPSYGPPCSTLRPSPEKYADVRQAHGNQHHLLCPASATDSVMLSAFALLPLY